MPSISQQQLDLLLQSAGSDEARALLMELKERREEPGLVEALAAAPTTLSPGRAADALEAVQRMFWRSAMGILTLRLPSPGGIILSINPSLSELLETPAEALCGMPLTQLLEISDEELTTAAEEAIKSSVSLKLRTRAEPARWLECELHAVLEARALAGAALVVRDITEQVVAAKQLMDGQRFVQVLQDLAPIAMCVTDEEGIYHLVNRAYCELYGYAEEELLGQSVAIVLDSDEAVARMHQAHRDFFSGRSDGNGDWEVRRRDGTRRHVKVSNALLDLGDGRRFVVRNIHDVTEQRRSEELRTKLDARLAQSQKLESLGLLAGGIAHDFNNMITGILANATFLHKSLKPNAEQYDALGDLEHTARRAAALLQTLTDYAGPRAATQSEQDLGGLVLDTLRLLRSGQRGEVELLCHRPHGALHVMMSPSQLQQVILNLLINAIEASEGSQSRVVSVSVERRHIDELLLIDAITANPIEPGDYAVIVVQDWGVGIRAEQQRVIFDPFFTTKAAGRGLGLASATSIIRAHGGAILLQSTPGIGTRFELLLPIFSARHPVNE